MCNYKDLNIEVTGVESPISKKKKKKKLIYPVLRSIEKEGWTSCTEMFAQVNWIIQLFIYVLLALGDPVKTELSLEAGGDACYRGGPETK